MRPWTVAVARSPNVEREALEGLSPADRPSIHQIVRPHSQLAVSVQPIYDETRSTPYAGHVTVRAREMHGRNVVTRVLQFRETENQTLLGSSTRRCESSYTLAATGLSGAQS